MLNLNLTLPEGREREAAIHCLQQMTQEQWEQMVRLALSVILLQEELGKHHYQLDPSKGKNSPLVELLSRPLLDQS